jgi:hypothetical protein
LDTLILGDLESEKTHAFSAPEGASVITNGARIILPPKGGGWAGDKIVFRMTIHPQHQNYVTVKFRNAESNQNLLFLFIEGKQIGYRPLGDYDVLCGANNEPLARDGYFYQTVPLPQSMTHGKTTIELAIGVTGWIWPYGTTFEQYQKAMTTPSRGICEVVTSNDPWLSPQNTKEAREEPARLMHPALNAEDVLSRVKARVNKDVQSILRKKMGTSNQMELHLLAKAYHTQWTEAFHNKKALEHVISGIDAHFMRYRKDPTFLYSDTSTWNCNWFCFGVLGDCIVLLEKDLSSLLDQQIRDENGKPLTRRAAWGELLQASLTYLRTHRRQYTNQAMISDLNLYRSNRGLRIVDEGKALPEQDARAYLYEAIGILPWLGSDGTDGKRTKPLGDQFCQLTEQGLTRELGYVGGYGEVLDWVVQIYDSTRDTWRGKGDTRIKDQLIRIAKARAIFRYPSVDDEGHCAMRMETVIGWRDMGLIGPVVYGAKSARDASSLSPAAVAQDAWSIGYAQQMLLDNQFLPSVQEHLQGGGLRQTLGLIDLPDDYAWIVSQSKSPYRLPMTPDGTDFIFSDLDDGVIALKRGNEIIYVSLYWRALFGINNLAKIHYLAPGTDIRATVVQHVEFANSGKTYRRPKNTDAGYGRHPYKEYATIPSAHEGEELPTAAIPAEAAGSTKVGLGNLFAGRGTFYHLTYGPYVFAMNCGTDKTVTIQLTSGEHKELSNGKRASGHIQVSPRSTRVFVKD